MTCSRLGVAFFNCRAPECVERCVVSNSAPVLQVADVHGADRTPRSRGGREVVARGYLPGSSCPTGGKLKTFHACMWGYQCASGFCDPSYRICMSHANQVVDVAALSRDLKRRQEAVARYEQDSAA